MAIAGAPVLTFSSIILSKPSVFLVLLVLGGGILFLTASMFLGLYNKCWGIEKYLQKKRAYLLQILYNGIEN